MNPPSWVGDATDPADAEVRAWLDGEERVRELGSAATEPLDDELSRLLRRPVPGPRSRPVFAPLMLGGLALTAVAVAWLLSSSPPPRLPAPIARIDGPAPVRFTADGAGDWAVAEHDQHGIIVAQTAGTVLYRVQPLPDDATLVVEAGDLEVEVVGTVFEVGTNAGDAWVTVYEGKVAVRDRGTERFLGAGEAWERFPAGPAIPARTRPAIPPPSLPSAPDPVAEYAVLLQAFEDGDRSEELRNGLWAFAAAHGDSPLGIDARAVALELAAARQDPRAVLTAIDSFLSANPETPRRPVLLGLEASLAKDALHDCRRAIPLYRRIAGESVGQARAEALAWQGLCAAGEGDPDAASILRASLREGIDGSLREQVSAAVVQLTAP